MCKRIDVDLFVFSGMTESRHTENKKRTSDKPQRTTEGDGLLHRLDPEMLQMEIDELKTEIKILKIHIENSSSSINDRISTIDDRTQEKLDTIDTALRGNERIGIFEQIRNIKTQIKVIILVLLLLTGAKIYSLSLDSWITNIVNPKKSEVISNSHIDAP